MTVRDWISRRSPAAPPVLAAQVLAALGGDADAAESRTAEVCIAAAVRLLDALLSDARFDRDGALPLLTVDALATYAFDHASQSVSEDRVAALADQGIHLFGQLMTQRV